MPVQAKQSSVSRAMKKSKSANITGKRGPPSHEYFLPFSLVFANISKDRFPHLTLNHTMKNFDIFREKAF